MPRKLVVSRRIKVYVVKYTRVEQRAHKIRDSTEFFFKPYSEEYIRNALAEKCKSKGFKLLSVEKPVMKYCRCDMDIDYYFKCSRKKYEEEI